MLHGNRARATASIREPPNITCLHWLHGLRTGQWHRFKYLRTSWRNCGSGFQPRSIPPTTRVATSSADNRRPQPPASAHRIERAVADGCGQMIVRAQLPVMILALPNLTRTTELPIDHQSGETFHRMQRRCPLFAEGSATKCTWSGITTAAYRMIRRRASSQRNDSSTIVAHASWARSASRCAQHVVIGAGTDVR